MFCSLRVKEVEPPSGAREGGKEGIGCGFCVEASFYLIDTNFSPSSPLNRERCLCVKRAQHLGSRAFWIELELPTAEVVVEVGESIKGSGSPPPLSLSSRSFQPPLCSSGPSLCLSLSPSLSGHLVALKPPNEMARRFESPLDSNARVNAKCHRASVTCVNAAPSSTPHRRRLPVFKMHAGAAL